MLPTITQELFDQYVRGTASAGEATAVRAWLAEPANQLVAQHWMRTHWETLEQAAAATEPDYDQLLARLHQQLGLDTHAPSETETVRMTPTWRRWVAAAALAGGLLGGGWGLWQVARPAAGPAALAATATPFGQKRLVRLPDGSQVTLNGNSRLRYAARWDAAATTPREVWLDGEGYFAVQHTPTHRRFVVHTTAGFDVEVLGTKFTVLRRAEQARVVLLSGKVRIDFNDGRRPDVLMKPGELVETRDAQPQTLVHKALSAAPAYAAWTNDRLVLDETTIAELAARLRDTYGLDVVVADPHLNDRKITGTVPLRDLDVLLQALEESFQLQVRRENNRLILSANPSHQPAL